MRLPNWFRVLWWSLLLVVVGRFLWLRYPTLLGGGATLSDVVVFLVWVALALAPVFKDMTLLGLRFRQELKEVREEISAFRAEFHTAVDVRNQFSPTVTVFPSIPAEQLPALADEIRKRAQVAGVMEVDVQRAAVIEDLPGDVTFLFRTRFALEREVRRIHRSRFATGGQDRATPAPRLIRELFQVGLIDRDAAVVAEELYRIASRAIHGEDIPGPQGKFAHDVAGWLLAELRAIP